IKNRKKDTTTDIKERLPYGLPESLVTRLEEYAVRNKVTTASILYSAWGLLLQKYNNCGDVIFGTTVAGRSANLKGIEEIAGLFINTLPLRLAVSNKDIEKIPVPNPITNTIRDTEKEAETVEKVIRQIHRHLQSRREYENTSLVNIKEYSSLDGTEELFDTLLVLENYPIDERLKQKEGALVIDSFSMAETTHYDLTVGITLFEGIQLEIDYDNSIFEKEKIR
ncbi:MAG: hypothetical protein GY765_00705, partial [bacterium]|nr:hypothetical protein [bacterium]